MSSRSGAAGQAAIPAPARPVPPPSFSVVVPAFNEAAVLPAFHARLRRVMDGLVADGLGGSWEVIYVNDGSTDGTLPFLLDLHRAEPCVGLVNLSRNFGKEPATTAGLDHARGEAVVVIDADLQDPPELIADMAAAWRRGVDVVYARRRERAGESWAKRATAALFYRVMGALGRVQVPRDVGDFRLMSRRVVDAVLRIREHHRFMKGIFAWVGFPSEAIVYDRLPRAGGETKWNYWKLWNFALEGITSYTVMPLKVSTYLGLAVALFAAAYGGVIVLRTVLFGNSVPGYPSLMAVVLFLGGAQLMTLGIIGEYLGRVFNETKHRPLYLVERHLPAELGADARPVASDQHRVG